MDLDIEIIGMAGSYISAVLETAGLYSMSNVLNDFSALLKPLAVLAYIACLVAALVSYLLQGSYRGALYFLVAPPAFYFLLLVTVPVSHTQHRFGTRSPVDEELRIKRAVASMFKEVNPDVRVPFVFAVYDNLISSVSQRLVSFLVDTQNNEDLIQAARDRVMSRVIITEGVEIEFLRLLAMSLMGDCARQTALAKALGEPRLAEAAPGSAEEAEAIAKRALYEELKVKKHALPRSVLAYLRSIEIEDVNTGETTSLEPVEDPTCAQIWDYTREACLYVGDKLLEPTDEFRQEFPEITDDQWELVYTEIREKLLPASATPAELVEAFRVLAAFYLRNTAASSAHGAFTAQLEGRQDWLIDEDANVSSEALDQLTNKHRSKLIDFAGLVPYVQGLLLYVLALMFPFAAIFLLIPTRVSSFFSWFWLWMWVKSWDVGFALVYQVREILWSFFPHTSDTVGLSSVSDLDWSDPSSVMHVIHQNDPSTSLFMYYSVVSLMTLLVPVFTGYLCRGATQIYYTVRKSLS